MNEIYVFFKFFTFACLALSGIIQLIRVQFVDDQLSFWSQVLYLLGAIIAIIYFAMVDHFDLAYPYIGASIVSSITLWGILRHNQMPWASL